MPSIAAELEVPAPQQAAELLQVPRRTVVRPCARGERLGARKLGRRWRIPRSALSAIFDRPGEGPADADLQEGPGEVGGQDLPRRPARRADRPRLEVRRGG